MFKEADNVTFLMKKTILFIQISLTILIGFISISDTYANSNKNVTNFHETSFFSGYLEHAYKINVSPGNDGLQANTSISYNSHSTRKKAGWVAAGWEIPLTYIQRNIQGTRIDTSNDTFELIIDVKKSNLVFVVSDGRYHMDIESYLKTEKKSGAPNDTGEYWTATAKDGTEFRFGFNLDSENMVNSSDPAVPQYVWRWSLDRIRDTNGNAIYFTYSENPSLPNDQGAVYLDKIEYNNDTKRVIEFILESTDRPDMTLTVEQGSEVQLARRLSEIRLTVDGQLVKKFMLEYILNAAGDKSLLRRITKYGTDGTALPPESYSYTTFTDPSNGEKTDILTGITNELGGTISMNYTISSSYPNTNLPYNYWLVSSITMDNGMTGPHATSSTSSISYENGMYDVPSDEFRGFGKVTETRPDGSKVVHHFHQDDAKKGIEWKTETLSSTDVIYEVMKSSWSETFMDPVYTVQLDSTEEYNYDGTPETYKQTRTEYKKYDKYGNAELVIDHGDVSVTGDEIYSYSEFTYNPDLWILDNVKHTYIKLDSDDEKIVRESWFYYDGAFNFDTQVPFKGNLTKTESWNDSGSNPVTIFQYDTYGNLVKATDPLGRISEVHYDDVYHTFPVEVINAKKQLTQSQYNPLTGQILSTTDPNGNTAQYQYDAFHRLVKAIAPYDSLSSPTVEIEYVINPSPPHTVITKRRETAGGNTLDSVQAVDGFGRLIQERAEYEDPAKIIVEDVYYDIMGRQFKGSNPYLADYSLDYSPPNTNMPAEIDEYDLLGRITKTTNPDGTESTSIFDHWTVTTTDENGHSKTYLYNAHDKLIQVVERNGVDEYTTNYQYNPLGELLSLTDHPGNTSTMAYDSLGRIVTMDDVDLGQRSVAYNLAGNRVSQTDARGITVNYQYDPLNRVTLINYPNDNDIDFVYDINTIGTVSSITDNLGTVSAKFDNRLRKTEETRTMDGYSWTTKWEYDSMDRVTRLTYPDGEEVTYTYTPQGLMGDMPGIISSLSYNAGSQITQQTYANSKVTTFTFNNLNERLTSINTPGIQNLSYTYDNVGNYKTVIDTIAGITETFDYDDLNRLTRAYDNAATGGYDTGYTYNAIGNMRTETNNKTSNVTQYTYGLGTATPHAVTGKSDQMPLVASFILDNGTAYCTTQQITLNNISMGYPTEYMASEDANFVGAAWQPFSSTPTFALSSGYGTKTIYFKVRNANGESKVKNDNIEYLLDSDGDQTADIYDDDDDNDGIPDAADTDPLDPANAGLDPDGDGLTNLQEYQNNTNPNLADSDGDGWNDYDEIFTYNTNPNNADTDGDGIDDSVDANPRNPYNDGFSENYSVKQWIFNAGGNTRRSSANYVANDEVGSGFSRGAYEDTDGDGMADSWELANGMDPSDLSDALLDHDGDGLTNLQEYLNSTNPDEADTDGDGWDDYAEIYIHNTDPTNSDSDGDGVPDSQDPNPGTVFHHGFSENYSVRGGFNAGGNVRNSTAYKTLDAIGDINRANAILNPSLLVTPEAIEFDGIEVGYSAAAILSIVNKSFDNIVIGTIKLAGADALEFDTVNDNCSERILSPNISCTIEIKFIPVSTGAKGAFLNIAYNDSEIKHATVPLRAIPLNDTTPPDTIITSTPSNPSAVTQATFTFESSEYNSIFECQLNSDIFADCVSPKEYTGLTNAAHTFTVRATDIVGNTDETAASYTWIIDTTLYDDNDGDSYPKATDCDDSDPLINRGASEGPFGDQTCSDTKDNDCDGTTDINDIDCLNVIYISPDGLCAGYIPCYSKIQDGLDEAVNGTIIKIAQGTYYENITLDRSISDLTIRGGWNSEFNVRSHNPSMTVINGDTTGDGFGDGIVLNLSALNSESIITTLDNMTVKNGIGPNNKAGGITVYAANNGNVNLSVTNVVIMENGGALGGMAIVSGPDPGSGYGGGSITLLLANSTVSGNEARVGGLAFGSSGSKLDVQLVNNTVTANVSTSSGVGGIYMRGSVLLHMKNTIVWGNTVQEGEKDIYIRGDSGMAAPVMSVSHSDIGKLLVDQTQSGTYNDLGYNINVDPLFTDSSYHLSHCSPLIDRGTSFGAPINDFEGDTRPFDGDGDSLSIADIGSDEFYASTMPYGDVNGDGEVNGKDTQACISHITGSQNWGGAADVNVDGIVDIKDIQLIIKIITETDCDKDGMPNDWEKANNLDMRDAGNINPDNGPEGNPDNDSHSNIEEYMAGSNPQNKGSRPVDLDIHFYKGLNLFGYPVTESSGLKSYDLLAMLGNGDEIEKILVFDKAAEKYEETYYDGSIPAGNNVDIDFGKGIKIYAKVDKTISFNSTVRPFNSYIECDLVELRKYTNVMTFPCAPPEYSSYDLLSELSHTTVSSIERFNTQTGMFEIAGYDNGVLVGKDFPIKAGEGYLIYILPSAPPMWLNVQ